MVRANEGTMLVTSTKIKACEHDDVVAELCLGGATPGRDERRRLVPANPGSALRPALRLDDLGDLKIKVTDNDKWNDADPRGDGGRRGHARVDHPRFDRYDRH